MTNIKPVDANVWETALLSYERERPSIVHHLLRSGHMSVVLRLGPIPLYPTDEPGMSTVRTTNLHFRIGRVHGCRGYDDFCQPATDLVRVEVLANGQLIDVIRMGTSQALDAPGLWKESGGRPRLPTVG